MAPTPEMEVDLERKEELVLAKMLRACSVNIRPKWQPLSEVSDCQPVVTDCPLTSSQSADCLLISDSLTQTPTQIQTPTPQPPRPISAIGQHYWSQCLGLPGATDTEQGGDRDFTTTKYSPTFPPWTTPSEEETGKWTETSVDNKAGRRDPSRLVTATVTDWAGILAEKDGKASWKPTKSSAGVARFPKPWVFEGPDPRNIERRSYVLDGISENKVTAINRFKEQTGDISLIESSEEMTAVQDCDTESAEQTNPENTPETSKEIHHDMSSPPLLASKAVLAPQQSPQSVLLANVEPKDVTSTIVNLFTGVPDSEKSNTVTLLLSFLATEQLLEVVSTLLSKEKLGEVILHAMDPQSRGQLIADFVSRDPDMETFLKKKTGRERAGPDRMCEGFCDEKSGLVTEESCEEERGLVTEGSCEEERGLFTEGSCEEERGLVTEESCEVERGLVTDESCEEERGLVTEGSCEEERGLFTEGSCEEERGLVTEESCEVERGLVTEESCEEERGLVTEGSCEEERGLVTEGSCEEERGLVTEAMECQEISAETSGDDMDVIHDEDDFTLETREKAIKENSNISQTPNPIPDDPQEAKDHSCDDNEAWEGSVIEVENSESEPGKEGEMSTDSKAADLTEISSSSETKTFTENLTVTDISETEVYEDEEDDWDVSEWDEVDNKHELLEKDDSQQHTHHTPAKDDYKVQTFAGSFSISVARK